MRKHRPRLISDLGSSVFICGSKTPGFLCVISLPAVGTVCPNQITLPPPWRFSATAYFSDAYTSRTRD